VRAPRGTVRFSRLRRGAGLAPSAGFSAVFSAFSWLTFVPSLLCYVFAAVFFLPATVLRGPRRVRAFVRVRWPRTGSALR